MLNYILILSFAEVADNFWVKNVVVAVRQFRSDNFAWATPLNHDVTEENEASVDWRIRRQTFGERERQSRSIERFEIWDLFHRWIWELELDPKNLGCCRLLSETCIRFWARSKSRRQNLISVKKYCFTIQNFYWILPSTCLVFTMEQDKLLAANSDADRII